MSSRCRELVVVLTLLAAGAGCEREQRRFSEPAGDEISLAAPVSDIRAGGASVVTAPRSPYDENAFALNEGQRLYEWFNCSGCHARGGGAIGPALMDEVWIYGKEPEQIYSTIVQGRPNGMPAFGARIPRQQVWQLVAYVRSLSGELSKAASPNRADSMHMAPAPSVIEDAPPEGTGARQP
jgi:cytochrome c oxidase cbb3-type subunit 3